MWKELASRTLFGGYENMTYIQTTNTLNMKKNSTAKKFNFILEPNPCLLLSRPCLLLNGFKCSEVIFIGSHHEPISVFVKVFRKTEHSFDKYIYFLANIYFYILHYIFIFLLYEILFVSDFMHLSMGLSQMTPK